jgi:hypothetical protein
VVLPVPGLPAKTRCRLSGGGAGPASRRPLDHLHQLDHRATSCLTRSSPTSDEQAVLAGPGHGEGPDPGLGLRAHDETGAGGVADRAALDGGGGAFADHQARGAGPGDPAVPQDRRTIPVPQEIPARSASGDVALLQDDGAGGLGGDAGPAAHDGEAAHPGLGRGVDLEAGQPAVGDAAALDGEPGAVGGPDRRAPGSIPDTAGGERHPGVLAGVDRAERAVRRRRSWPAAPRERSARQQPVGPAAGHRGALRRSAGRCPGPPGPSRPARSTWQSTSSARLSSVGCSPRGRSRPAGGSSAAARPRCRRRRPRPCRYAGSRSGRAGPRRPGSPGSPGPRGGASCPAPVRPRRLCPPPGSPARRRPPRPPPAARCGRDRRSGSRAGRHGRRPVRGHRTR